MTTCLRAGAWELGTWCHWQSSRQGRPVAERPGRRERHAGWACGRTGYEWVGRCYCFLHMIQGLGEGQVPRAQSHGLLSGGGTLEDPRALAQDLAELLQTPLHLGNACQLLLKPLLLLGQGQAGGRVQLLELPAALPVEL